MTNYVAEQRAQELAELPFESLGPVKGIFRGPIGAIKEVIANRELLNLLVRREIRARYKDSALGFIWSLVKPIFQLLVYWLILGELIGARGDLKDFGVFIFAGLTLWGLFSETVSGGTTSIITNSGLVKKTYLPREVFPLAATGSALFNFCMQLIVLTAATFFTEYGPPTGWRILYIPAAALLITVFATALGTLLGAMNVYLRDIQHLVDIMMMLLMWASPIVYPFTLVISKVGAGSILEQIYLANPITIGVLAMQKGAWSAASAVPGGFFPADLNMRLGIAFLASLVLLWIAQRVFSKLSGNFAQEL